MLGESTMRAVFAGMFTACAVASAQAQDRPIELATAPGRDAVEKYCGTCHSLDYLTTNSPILDRQGWTSEVDKMIKPSARRSILTRRRLLLTIWQTTTERGATWARSATAKTSCH
jgi:hypothetical protein